MEVIIIKDYRSYYNAKDGMYYVDKSYPCKKKLHDHCCDHKSDKEKGKLVEFAYQNADPISNLPPGPGGQALPRIVATVRLNDVKAGNVVSLNGLFHINNDSALVQDLVASIYRGTPSPGNLIYRAVFEIDNAENVDDDFTQAVVQFVDDGIKSDQKNVTYTLFAEQRIGTNGLFLAGPITFTATEIKGSF
ncbi:hypothetical protein ACI3ER_28855 [Bacillus sp. Wb]